MPTFLKSFTVELATNPCTPPPLGTPSTLPLSSATTATRLETSAAFYAQRLQRLPAQ